MAAVNACRRRKDKSAAGFCTRIRDSLHTFKIYPLCLFLIANGRLRVSDSRKMHDHVRSLKHPFQVGVHYVFFKKTHSLFLGQIKKRRIALRCEIVDYSYLVQVKSERADEARADMPEPTCYDYRLLG